MADTKTTALTALAAAAESDILPIVDDPAGTPVTKKIAISDLLTARTFAGATFTGVVDAGGASSFEIPNSATPTVDAAGEIAVDTSITDHTGLIKYHDGVEELVVVAMPSANLVATDTYVVSYNAANNEFEMVAQSGGSSLPIDDATAVVKGSADATKLVRIEADGITTGTTRVITMPDADVDLGALAAKTGNVYTGVHDFGGAGSLEIPNSATPTVDAAGEIAVDTTITDHTGLIKYHDGVEELVVVAMPTANLISTDAYVVAYNAADNEFEMVSPTAAGDIWGADQNSAGYGIDDTNGNELVTFATVASAVNYLRIKNGAAGQFVFLEAIGDDTDVNLMIDGKGAGVVRFGNSPVEFYEKAIWSDSASIPPLNITARGSAPSAPATNDIYLDDGTNHASGGVGFMWYDGATWQSVGGI